MLVLQSVAGALALGAGPNPMQLDAFGNPLCITSTDHGDAGTGGSDHSRLPNCCMAGCGMVAPVLGAPSEHSVAVLRPRPVSGSIAREYAAGISFATSDHDPGNPRAPPLTA